MSPLGHGRDPSITPLMPGYYPSPQRRNSSGKDAPYPVRQQNGQHGADAAAGHRNYEPQRALSSMASQTHPQQPHVQLGDHYRQPDQYYPPRNDRGEHRGEATDIPRPPLNNQPLAYVGTSGMRTNVTISPSEAFLSPSAPNSGHLFKAPSEAIGGPPSESPSNNGNVPPLQQQHQPSRLGFPARGGSFGQRWSSSNGLTPPPSLADAASPVDQRQRYVPGSSSLAVPWGQDQQSVRPPPQQQQQQQRGGDSLDNFRAAAAHPFSLQPQQTPSAAPKGSWSGYATPIRQQQQAVGSGPLYSPKPPPWGTDPAAYGGGPAMARHGESLPVQASARSAGLAQRAGLGAAGCMGTSLC